jgi:hypothetical protein
VECSRCTDVGAEWLWSVPNTPISSKFRTLLILRSSGAGAEHLWSMSHTSISFKLKSLILKELPGPGAEWLWSASVITDIMSLHDTECWTGRLYGWQ